MLEFWRFKPVDTENLLAISGEYDYILVVLSVCVAALATYSALIVLERIWASSHKNTLNIWLWFAAAVMGVGVWAMHFTGMLAFMIPVPMAFDAWITLASAIPSIFGAYVALNILAKRRFGFWWIQAGSLALASGIGTMHFVGMEAMIMDVQLHYNFFLFAGSIVVAHVLATIALYVRVIVNTNENSRPYWRMFSALVMGCAVAGMHYTAMASAKYYVMKGTALGHEMLRSNSLALSLTILGLVALFVGITVIGTLIDRRLQSAEYTAEVLATRGRAVVETLEDALLVIDAKGKIEAFNSSGYRMFMHNDESVIGKKIELLMPDISHNDLVKDTEQDKSEIIGRTIELKGIRADGKSFPAEVRFSKMLLGSQLMFNAVIRDISERKRLEGQLRQSQKLESIGQLAAGIAHEINTPIQYISDNTSFLKKSFAGILTVLQAADDLVKPAVVNSTTINNDSIKVRITDLEKVRAALKNAKIDYMLLEIPKAIDQSLDGLQRVSTIVSAMKSFSHPSEGKKQRTNLQETIETTATIARNEWKYVAKLSFDFAPDLPLVPCLRDELNQVILNIIVNAAHAIADTLDTTDRTQGHISISTAYDKQFAIITIADDGKGMSNSIQQKIFDPFFTTKEVGKGTGQGLSLAYSVIVEKHQGDISVSSEEGKGSTFVIRLPLDDLGFSNEEAGVLRTAVV